jgi:transcription antitermination factor NusG
MRTETGNWYALHVKPRHEFATNSELTRKGIVTCLPAVTKLRQWKDRKKLVDFPLFPGYLFVCVEPCHEDFNRVLRTPGSLTLLSTVPGTPTPIPPHEIHSLMLLMKNAEDIDVYPHLTPGSRVRVRRGIFTGAEGVLLKKENHLLFVVSIDILSRSVGVRMYADDLEAA